MAKDVNLVMHPPYAGQGQIELLQGGTPLAAEDAGQDVRIEAGRALVDVATPRMYRLANNREIDTYELTIVTRSDGVALYAFTFGSCLVPAT
jgi:hypothetical protein